MDGEIKDFSRKGHVIYSEILLPEYAPKEFADRSVLWNAVENFEKGSRAQLSRVQNILHDLFLKNLLSPHHIRNISLSHSGMQQKPQPTAVFPHPC